MDFTHIGHGFRRTAHIRLGYDLQQGRATAIQINPGLAMKVLMQGFPGMMEVNRNTVNKLNERNRRRMFFGFETLTLYQGFNLLVTSGMRRDKQEWVRSYGRPEAGDTEYFITLRVEASQ